MCACVCMFICGGVCVFICGEHVCMCMCMCACSYVGNMCVCDLMAGRLDTERTS